MLEELSIRNPVVWQYTADLSRVYMNLRQQLPVVQQPPDALKTARQSITLLRDLSATVPHYQLDLGVALSAADRLLAITKEWKQVIARLEKS
ncbi:MAG: hypothetical protein MK171_11525 [Pirellulales bacterium]|nr:hypothetical protein [Pirellulales bacterium]